MRKAFMLATALLAATAVWAQGPRGMRGVGMGPQRGASLLDMTKITLVEGTVSAVNLAYGAQYPAIEISKTRIKVAPVWFLLENDFEIKTGDRLRVTGAPSTVDAYLHAIEILNLASNARITLRDSNGLPEWTSRGGMFGAGGGLGPGAPGGCIDPASVTTLSGLAEQVTAGPGIQQPTLVLKPADGNLVSIKIGPERILLQNDFELNAGQAVMAKVAVASCTGEQIALELSSGGVTVVLRNADGTPAWR